MAKIIEIPATVAVHVPKLGETVSVSIPETTGDDVLLHILHHGMKQKLVDATAGINSADYATKEEFVAAVRAAVDSRMATLLTVPSERAFGPRNPVETEARRFVAVFLLKHKAASKASDAAERTSTFAKARAAFEEVVAAKAESALKASGEEYDSDTIAALVKRNWENIIMKPAAAEVERRKASVEGLEVQL